MPIPVNPGQRPKAKKKPGSPPRRVPGRKQEVRELPNGKWIFQFKRNDFEDFEFETEAEAKEYQRQIKLSSIKGSPLRVRRG